MQTTIAFQAELVQAAVPFATESVSEVQRMRGKALSTEAVIQAAVQVADEGGLDAVSMRSVARVLGVEAMSLYHHVRNKDAMIDGLADWIFARLGLPPIDQGWRAYLVDRAQAQRRELRAHPWALGMLESRSNPGVWVLRHHDAVLGVLRRAGFSIPLAAHTFSVVDAYVFGFVLTELGLPFTDGATADEFVGALELPDEEFPYMSEFVAAYVVGQNYDYGDEFAIGLDIILDEVERRREAL